MVIAKTALFIDNGEMSFIYIYVLEIWERIKSIWIQKMNYPLNREPVFMSLKENFLK